MSAAASTTNTAPVVTAASGPAIRLVLQRVNSAALLVDNVSRRVSMNKGIVCHCAFFDGATETHIQKAVKLITESKLFAFDAVPLPAASSGGENKKEGEEGEAKKEQTPAPRPKPASLIDDSSLSLMIVPQASIAGRVKGKTAQYHAQCKKESAQDLYQLFIGSLRKALLPTDFMKKHGHLLDVNGELQQQEQEQQVSENNTSEDKSKTKVVECERKVYNGTYGNIQALNFDSPGPMTHVLDVDL